MLSWLIKLFSKIFLWTGLVGSKNAFAKPLSQEEEEALFLALKAGDRAAEEKLIRHNLRLVAFIAKKYKGQADNDDLISVGSMGLLKAIKTFDKGKGNSFSTYASRCIENEILMMFRSEKRHALNVSLEEDIGVDKEGNTISLIDILAADEEDGVEKIVENKLLYKKVEAVINKSLSGREREIICRRYGVNGYGIQTQKQVAVAMGISRSYVSRLETHAIDIIKNELTSEGVKSDRSNSRGF